MDVVLTNCSIYRNIAVEAHQHMVEAAAASRRPRADGGWIISYDPDRRCFKAACVSIVFTGIWLEAATHLAYARLGRLADLKKFDSQVYENKLVALGFEPTVLEQAKRLRLARKELVHEKAYLDSGEMRFAQAEAENANQLLRALSDDTGRLVLANRPQPTSGGSDRVE